MKKLVLASVSALALLSVAACSDSADNTTTQSVPDTTTTEPAQSGPFIRRKPVSIGFFHVRRPDRAPKRFCRPLGRRALRRRFSRQSPVFALERFILAVKRTKEAACRYGSFSSA